MSEDGTRNCETSEVAEQRFAEIARDRPKSAELFRSLFKNVTQFLDRWKDESLRGWADESHVAFENELQRLANAFAEVRSWAAPANDELESRQSFTNWMNDEWVKDLLNRGLVNLDQVYQAFRSIEEESPRGRPASKRYKALQALNEQARVERDHGRRISWAQLAKKFQYCDDDPSKPSLDMCGHRLRKQATELDRLIARLSSGEKE